MSRAGACRLRTGYLAGLALLLALTKGASATAGDPAAPGDFDAALAAAAAGRMGSAAAGFHDLAVAGDATAAYNLAVLFATGRGLPQNDALALHWAWRARLGGIAPAAALIARLQPGLPETQRDKIANGLIQHLTPGATKGDGAAMLQLAAVLAHVRPKPDLVAAYGWQSLAAMLDVPGASAAHAATWQALSAAERALAQDAALALARDWCRQTTPAPAVCAALAEDAGPQQAGP